MEAKYNASASTPSPPDTYCKLEFVDAAAGFKKTKQWDVAAKFAERAEPIARGMVVFDDASHNGARDAVLSALASLTPCDAAKSSS